MKWQHNLQTKGKILRKIINDGGEDLTSCRKTLSALKDCYDEIRKFLSEE